jgi:hypothetical protein
MHSTANSQQRNLMQGVAGGLRAEYAGVLRAPVPERLGRLMRRLDDDRAEHLDVRLSDRPYRNAQQYRS